MLRNYFAIKTKRSISDVETGAHLQYLTILTNYYKSVRQIRQRDLCYERIKSRLGNHRGHTDDGRHMHGISRLYKFFDC